MLKMIQSSLMIIIFFLGFDTGIIVSYNLTFSVYTCAVFGHLDHPMRNFCFLIYHYFSSTSRL